MRLNFASLVVNLPVGQDLYFVSDMNNSGDLIGSSSTGANFLLQRLDAGDRQAHSTPLVKNVRHAIPPVIAIMRSRLQPQARQLK